MTYEEIVFKVRECFENADAREIFEHIAVQVNIEGEGSGAFYIEVAERYISVEPYDYHDRDGLLTATGETLLAIADQRLTLTEAVENGALKAQGNPDKLRMLMKIKFKKDEPKEDVQEESVEELENLSELADQIDLAVEDGLISGLGELGAAFNNMLEEVAKQLADAFTETADEVAKALDTETEKLKESAKKAPKKTAAKKTAATTAEKKTAKKSEEKTETKKAAKETEEKSEAKKTTAKKTTKAKEEPKPEVKAEEKKAEPVKAEKQVGAKTTIKKKVMVKKDDSATK